jgi:hypothetical protein
MKYLLKSQKSGLLAFIIICMIFFMSSPSFSEIKSLSPDQLHSIMGYVGDEVNISLIVGSTGMMDGNQKFILIPASDCMAMVMFKKQIMEQLRYNLHIKPMEQTGEDISEAAKFLTFAEINCTGKVKDFLDTLDKKDPKKKGSKFIVIEIEKPENLKVISLEKELPGRLVTRIVFVDDNHAPYMTSPDVKNQKIMKYAQNGISMEVKSTKGDWFEVAEEYSIGREPKTTGWIEKKFLSCKNTEFANLYQPQKRMASLYKLKD